MTLKKTEQNRSETLSQYFIQCKLFTIPFEFGHPKFKPQKSTHEKQKPLQPLSQYLKFADNPLVFFAHSPTRIVFPSHSQSYSFIPTSIF